MSLNIESLENEVWKDIPSLKGRYQASNMGRIKRIASGKIREHILKQFRVGEYMSVGPSVNNVRVQRRVHRLVAMAFIPNPNNLPEVNHKNEDKTDNKVENLDYCDRAYNCNYGTRNKKIAEKLKNNHGNKSVIGINKITGLTLEFDSAREAERVLGINNGNIIGCCKGKKKSAGGFQWYYANDNADAE